MSSQQTIRLFPDDDTPCTTCKGKGAIGPTWDTRTCPGCGGTGLRKDQPNPENTRIPY